MKNAITAFILRVKVQCYALLFRVQQLLRRVAQALPGCWIVLGIPRREIPDIEKWVSETLRTGQTFGSDGRAPEYFSFDAPDRVPRRNSAPPGVDRVHPELRHQYLEFQAPFLAALPSARILGPGGSVITPDGGILTQSTWSHAVFQQDRIYRSLRLPKPEFLSGSYYTIASPFAYNYYHWVVEVLPRLFAYESVAQNHPRLIVNSPLNTWQLESLALLGFREEDLFTLGGEYLQVQNLYFPSLLGINPYTLRWLKERLDEFITPEPTSKRVYITRRLASKRRLINEDELESILQEHGFIIAELESLSFTEQVRLFAGAEMIVGLHGAGLTNMAFAPHDCKVMEIVPPDYVNVMYYMLAEVLHQRYWFCIGQPLADNSLRHGGTHGHGDVTVSPQLFRDTLLEMINTETKASSSVEFAL